MKSMARTSIRAGPRGAPLEFASPLAWRRWLAREHSQSKGVWLRLKAGKGRGLTYVRALHEALCYGWMDGSRRPGAQLSWLQQFKPRGPRSRWSRLQAENAERLIKAGRMRPAGMRQVLAAQADGRWRGAYHPPGSARLPADLLKALAQDATARAFFAGLPKAAHYALAYRLQSAHNAVLRARRLGRILKRLAQGRR
jgi:uncharacterized protein YdeI (YjbR/CyaY-like superfamily)